MRIRFFQKMLLVVAVCLAVVPGTARAAFHLMKIVEVFPGTAAEPNAQYVELQMYSAGQNSVSGHTIHVFGANGTTSLGSFSFSGSVASGSSQSRILVATSEAAALFGITADLTMTAVIPLESGKICFDTIDCFTWGSTTGAGTPFGSLELNKAAIRDVSANTAGQLDGADDTNNSLADFDVGLPSPQNNAGSSGTPPTSTCGNDILEGLEDCDDNNTSDGDGCSATCTIEIPDPVCGNDVLEAGEECDDNNTTDGDGCSATCTIEMPDPVCGNDVLEDGEECDDNNTTDGDGCSATCTIEVPDPVCGNGILEAGEECDDNNTTDDDGCSAACIEQDPCGAEDACPGTRDSADEGGCAATTPGIWALLALLAGLVRIKNTAMRQS